MNEHPLSRLLDWTERERRNYHPGSELRRVLRRGRTRPILTLAIVLALTGLVVLKVARRPTFYRAYLLFKVDEGSVTDEPATRPPSELQSYVWHASLANANLLPIVKARNLYPERRVHSDDLAVGQLKNDLELEVYQNYFAEYRTADAAPRSARLYLSYRALDPDLAYEVVQDVGRAIVDFEARSRQQVSEFAAQAARRAVDEAHLTIRRHQEELAATMVALESDPADPAALRVVVARLHGALAGDEARLRVLESRRRHLDLLRAVEEQQLGMSFHVVDSFRPPRVERSLTTVVVAGIVAFVILLPLTAIGVGAFDSRIRDGDDIARLGLNVVGHVPAFPGDEVGSLAARGAGRLHVG